EGWIVAPLDRDKAAEVLYIHGGANCEKADSLAALLAACLEIVRRQEADRRRVERLSAMLEMTQYWNRMHEMEPLLQHMAEASTRLLHSDRASIFLWDRPNKSL